MGLPGSSECSLDVPSDGGLAVEAAPKTAVCGGTDVGSRLGCSSFGFLASAMKLPTTTCTGVAAISIPATQPPTMRPSLPASATLKPPVLLRVSPSSASKNEPERESISKWPSYVTIPPEVAGCRSVAVHRAPFAEIMHVVRGPCWEKAIILDATSSLGFTVIMWGVNDVPEDPKASSCFFLPDPGGRPLRLPSGLGVDPPPPDWAPVASVTPAAAVLSPKPMLPSGPYFLGLPLFFFTRSPPLTATIAPPLAPTPPEPGCCCCKPVAPESGRYIDPSGMSTIFMLLMGDEASGEAIGLKARDIPCITLAAEACGNPDGGGAAPNAAACCIMTPPAPACGGDPTRGGACCCCGCWCRSRTSISRQGGENPRAGAPAQLPSPVPQRASSGTVHMRSSRRLDVTFLPVQQKTDLEIE
uniref:Uncharacterized protein n=1 Tax=Zea mays TaxID=4577 RepID=B7ZX39_MAIZE|nr:unknown [Zea mays]